LKIENEDNYNMRLDVLDYKFHIGASINREENWNSWIMWDEFDSENWVVEYHLEGEDPVGPF